MNDVEVFETVTGCRQWMILGSNISVGKSASQGMLIECKLKMKSSPAEDSLQCLRVVSKGIPVAVVGWKKDFEGISALERIRFLTYK